MRSWHVGVAQWSLIVHYYLSIYFCASDKAPYVKLPGYMSVSKEVMPKLLGAGLGRDKTEAEFKTLSIELCLHGTS